MFGIYPGRRSHLSGISVIVACLTINQAAYVVGTIRANDGPNDGSVEALPQQRADDEPHDGRNDDIRSEHKRQQNSQFKLANQANEMPPTAPLIASRPPWTPSIRTPSSDDDRRKPLAETFPHVT
jgi:hypothetical protein